MRRGKSNPYCTETFPCRDTGARCFDWRWSAVAYGPCQSNCIRPSSAVPYVPWPCPFAGTAHPSPRPESLRQCADTVSLRRPPGQQPGIRPHVQRIHREDDERDGPVATVRRRFRSTSIVTGAASRPGPHQALGRSMQNSAVHACGIQPTWQPAAMIHVFRQDRMPADPTMARPAGSHLETRS